MLQHRALDPEHPPKGEPSDANAILDRALAFWNNPTLADSTRRVLLWFANGALRSAKESWEKAATPAQVENALRQLIAMSPELQTS
jgi:Flp pilus assembly protein TadD